MFDSPTTFDSTIPQPAQADPAAPEPDRARPIRAGASPLVSGTLLGEFEIVRVIGSGGFGIVYLANDRLLLRQVAIKEYLPATLARRGVGQTVVVHHQNAARSFAAGLASFLNEAQLLARFDHPALVKVHRFWRANDTAYMAMPYYLGRTLKDERLAMGAAPSETWLRKLAEPLLSALDLLHRQSILHRDISPDNIMLGPEGRPVLLDFGSARHAIGDRTHMMTVVLKPNFAPIEQYGDDTSLRQGPWTDLYALGATLRFALTGQAPIPSAIRAVRDELAPLASASLAPQVSAPTTVSPLFLAAIDWALIVAPEGRPQDVAALRRAMRGEAAVPTHSAANDEEPMRSRWWRPITASIGGVLIALAAGAGWVAWRGHAGGPPPVLSSAAARSAPSTPITTQPAHPPEAEAVQAPTSEIPRRRAETRFAATPEKADAHRSAGKRRSQAARRTEAVTAGAARMIGRVREGDAAAAVASRAVVADPVAKIGPGDLESCANLGFFARQLCMDRQCARPEAQANARCAERRRREDERLRRMQQ